MGNLVIGRSLVSSIEPEQNETYVDLNQTSKPVLKDGRVTYKVAKLVDVKAVKNSLANLFRWMPGERVLLPEYGSNLRRLLYRGITDETECAIVAEIQHSISQWEPRVELQQVINVSTTDDTERNTIKLQIVYNIVGLNGQSFSYTYEAQNGEE